MGTWVVGHLNLPINYLSHTLIILSLTFFGKWKTHVCLYIGSCTTLFFFFYHNADLLNNKIQVGDTITMF